MNRAQLKKLSRLRIREAKVLLDKRCYQGSYYLAGYSVECALKACIAKQTRLYDFPDKERVTKSYSHKLKDLVEVAQLKSALDNEVKSNQQFGANWTMVVEWSESFRYNLTMPEKKARDFHAAISDQMDGVLPWLEKYW